MASFALNNHLTTFRHRFDEFSTCCFNFVIMKPYLNHGLNHEVFGGAVSLPQSLLANCPKIFYGIQVRGVSGPRQHLYIAFCEEFGALL